ncbi:EamA family transporter [Hymenobacter taeanensis]|uniref:EamA family transporter n=1 Tax=Hymenobacter taeanensis TaxID=2735321 RepID=A0A6M6BHQ0_9BACT|nr:MULTISPECIES: EamA family transporter [Hymenobacter]QJX47428.1 EamA family transporter [Hymenobacter taeanensis]UOQ83090.1 EamA family transporter [Hymenobacter sp. 5414T-23]
MPTSRRFTLPPLPAVLLSIVSVQGGAAIAKGLFPVLGAAGTASVRIGFSALLLLLVVRPRLGQLQRPQWRAVVPYGLALGSMNFLFYCALARIPLGLAVTLEFVGPLVLALTGSRRWSDVIWVVLAGAGIALIAPWSGHGIDMLGLVFALAAGAAWAIYIVLSQRAAALLPGPVAVTVGMVVAALLILPFGIGSGQLATVTPHWLLLGSLLAVFSSVLPFTLEMQALKSMPTRTFSILMSLEPVAAAFSGWLLLNEHLTRNQWLAVGLIVVASAGATLTSTPTHTAVANE